MTAVVAPDEEEAYLLAIMDGSDGIDLAEFCWVDEEQDDGCFRAWDFQWPWYTCEDILQVDQCGRSLGKSNGVTMRAFAFCFNWPGAQMLITAPELNHLRPLTDLVEERLLSTRMSNEMLPRTKGRGIARQPHWQARFSNGAMIISRLPNRDGKGIKGMHPLVLEGDEMQDYPKPGWSNLIETLKRGSKGAQWRCHGVSRGVRDTYYTITQPDSEFTVHKYGAMYRPTWTAEERREKISHYGGSRQNPEYKRNIYGEHGDATNPVFVMARLMACVDTDEGSTYNTDVYANVHLELEMLTADLARLADPALDEEQKAEMRRAIVAPYIDLPAAHKRGWSMFQTPELDDGRRGTPREVGAVRGYSAYYGGMDVGMTNHPSEILVFGQREGTDKLDLLLRVHLQRIDTEMQVAIVEAVFAYYGLKLKSFGIDKTGIGFSVWQILSNKAGIADRVHGYNFSEKHPVGFEERELVGTETKADLAIYRNVVEHATDTLRIEYVDPKRILLPYDKELLTEWQGQNYIEVPTGSPYGKKNYERGKFHTLDAGKAMAAAKTLPQIAAMLEERPEHVMVLDVFVGA